MKGTKEAWMYGRKTPYTESGVKRLSCVRCGQKAKYQWQVCADNSLYRPICAECDVALNALVLRWVGMPNAEEKIKMYAEQKGISRINLT